MTQTFRTIKTYYFWIFLTVGVGIYFCQRLGIWIPDWVNNYVNDFLCLPIVLFISQAVVRFLRRDKNIVLPLALVLLMALFYSIYFEYFMAEYSPRYTADAIDVVLYFMGALFFFLLENRKNPNWKSV